MILGVTGKYCAGKSTLARILTEDYGFLEIDVDKLGHRALEERAKEIIAAFGPEVEVARGGSSDAGSGRGAETRSGGTPEGRIDRRKLGDIVFADRKALERLESIVHPVMRAEVVRFIDEHPGRDIIVNAAVLFTMRLEELCDLVIIVDAPFLKRIRRARDRDNLGLFQVLRRFASQRKMRLQSGAGDVDIYTVRNDGDRAALGRRISFILDKEGHR
jgi:dephospho-CoA kinase